MPRHDPLPDHKPETARSLHERANLDRDAEIRRRQRSRSIVTAVILFALVALFYFISLAKML